MKPVKVKETTLSRLSLATVALATVLVASGVFCSCTKNGVELLPSDSKQITLSASVGTIGVETEAQGKAQTKALVVDTDVQTLYFARADGNYDETYGNYATTAITASRPAGVGTQQLTFSPIQYYRTDKLKTKLTGWYPGGATAVGDASGKGYYNGSTHTVTWTINGQQDILTAPRVEGSTLNPISSSMTFSHRLTQLRFHPYAEDQRTVDAWGKITKIEVLNQQNTVSYALSDDDSGKVTFSGNATNTFSAGVALSGTAMSLSTNADKIANAMQMGDAVMIAPQSSDSYTLTLKIGTEHQGEKTVTLTRKFEAEIPYKIYLRFMDLEMSIIPEVAITDWTDQNINVEY